MVIAAPIQNTPGQSSTVSLGGCTRRAIIALPDGRGNARSQAAETIAALQSALENPDAPMRLVSATVFFRAPGDEPVLRAMLIEAFGSLVITFVNQPPCCGAALIIEAWAIGGPDVRLEEFGRHAVAWSHDGARWVHCGDIAAADHPEGVYAQSSIALQRMGRALRDAGASLENVVRTWFYLGQIVGEDGETQRYKELNRARTDFYNGVTFQSRLLQEPNAQAFYPASTGIGMDGRGLSASCLALQTTREDVRLLALENPQQTPAYTYHPRYSPQSPKFSRAMALALGHSITTWVSGTASIVNSESQHEGSPERQTEQTIENIERLISAGNFKSHGMPGAGATLHDLAKARVYVKRPEDFDAVRSVCLRRFGPVPVVYVVADVCRPELLVEIEGVAFSRLA